MVVEIAVSAMLLFNAFSRQQKISAPYFRELLAVYALQARLLCACAPRAAALRHFAAIMLFSTRVDVYAGAPCYILRYTRY